MRSENEGQRTWQAPSALSAEEFVSAFGALYEHSPWVAERAYAAAVETRSDTLGALSTLFVKTLDSATRQEKLALIRAHPDLAGKAAAAGELTDDSNDEQSSAGLDQCTEAELQRFHTLNDAYKEKFEFPFIMAVKNSDRHLILAAFETRINNSLEDEFDTAIGEINKIALLRLQPYFSNE